MKQRTLWAALLLVAAIVGFSLLPPTVHAQSQSQPPTITASAHFPPSQVRSRIMIEPGRQKAGAEKTRTGESLSALPAGFAEPRLRRDDLLGLDRHGGLPAVA